MSSKEHSQSASSSRRDELWSIIHVCRFKANVYAPVKTKGCRVGRSGMDSPGTRAGSHCLSGISQANQQSRRGFLKSSCSEVTVSFGSQSQTSGLCFSVWSEKTSTTLPTSVFSSLFLPRVEVGARAMAQRLRTLATLPEDLTLILSIHTMAPGHLEPQVQRIRHRLLTFVVPGGHTVSIHILGISTKAKLFYTN